MSNSENITSPPRINRDPLTAVLIGGLALQGQIDATAIMSRTRVMDMDATAAATAILGLIDRGLASVIREGTCGCVMATPALNALDIRERVHGVTAYLAVTWAAEVNGHA